MTLQQRFEIQASVQQWVDDFMQNYNIPAAEMEDALSKVLLGLKDKALVEYLTEIAQQQTQMQVAAQQENPIDQTPQEE